MTKETLGNRIERARTSKGYNITQLSQRLAVKPMTLKAWETGKSEPRANKLSTLSGLLGVNINWLLAGDGDMPTFAAQPTDAKKVAIKVSQAITLQQRLSRLLTELESDVAHLKEA